MGTKPTSEAPLCELIAGGLPKHLSATRAATELRRIRPADAIGVERRHLAAELLSDVRRVDADLDASSGPNPRHRLNPAGTPTQPRASPR